MSKGSSSSTATNTTSNYYDQRSVVDASGGGFVGSGNAIDASQTWTQYTDTSNRSTTNWTDQSQTNWTQNTDNSNRSTTNWTDNSQTNWTQNTDNSNRSTTNWTQTTNVVDAGQTDMARQVALAAIKAASDSSASATSAAISAQNSAVASNEKAVKQVLDLASSNSNAAFKSSADAMGWAGERFDQLAGLTGDLLKAGQKQADAAATNVAAAYDNAASQANGNKTLTIAALAAVGLVAAVVVFSNRKG
ncbi:hypothetical protein CDN99_25590 [Roseateles aquatilis]|uniref:Uncharacterized protein n=1 Tax=Roseateles aquatilis TaxID=431061 RepID=A0A246IUE8_9BURK|nr:hypothetical protein [Roseateles aquatilis]OWQ83842.1 hypothetical protein CDN99_25590 [Roseateles aquatilis]